MARHFGKMLCTLWDDPDFLTLSSDAKVLFSAFFSQPDISPAGILPWTERRWRRWLNGDAEKVEAAFDELVAGRYVVADEDTSEVLVRSFIKTDARLANAKLAASVRLAVEQIRSANLFACVQREHPNVFPGRRPIPATSKANTADVEGLSVESRWDLDVKKRNGEEETTISDGPSADEEPLPRAVRLELLQKAGAPDHLLTARREA